MLLLKLPYASSYLLDLVVTLCILCSFIMLGSRWSINHIKAFTVQVWLVSVVSLIMAIHLSSVEFYVLSVINAIFRGVFLPYVFYRMLIKHEFARETNASIQAGLGLLFCMVLVVYSVAVTSRLTEVLSIDTILTSLTLTATFSIVLIGFLKLISRHQALSKVIALLMIENGVSLGGQLLAQDSNILIAMIVVVDVLVAAVAFQILSGYLLEQVSETDNRALTRLTG